MKFVLIWAIIGANGIGSGAAEFDDQRACEAAGSRLTAFVQVMQNKQLPTQYRPGDPKADFTCAPKASGKP